MQTTVKWFNVSKGYGFLENGTGPDIYVNAKSLRGTDKMNTGDLVEFECHVFEGKLVARHVRQVRREGNAPIAAKSNGNSHNSDTFGNREQHPGRLQQPRFVMQ
ncbi:MAG: cold shock domain-containing protein [Spongiibacteraceae bacterium]